MNRKLKLLTTCLLTQLVPTAASLQETEDDGDRSCVTLRTIDRTEVIDKRTIVFHLKGGDIFVNRLDRTCPGLAPDKAFSYRTQLSRLCDVDNITVVERGAFGFSNGASCGLGLFEAIDEDTLAMIKGDEPDAEVRVIPIDVEE
jgi:hypothetical protein